MVAYTRDEIISATDLARNVSGTLSKIIKNKNEKIAIAKNNKLEAVIINIEEYERLKKAYELMEHIEIAKIVEERSKTSKSKYITFEESAKKLGISIDEL
jgi:PHD/YefM family antitoxin component YafN of YafNO toxin-antitoxin module